jgi:hypothetical protein
MATRDSFEPVDRAARANESLSEQQPGRQILVPPWSAQHHAGVQTLACSAVDDFELQRFFNGNQI